MSYLEFVQSMHLPRQLAQVDPIVASFCGGAVGVLSALLVVEVNNVEKQQKNRWGGGGEQRWWAGGIGAPALPLGGMRPVQLSGEAERGIDHSVITKRAACLGESNWLWYAAAVTPCIVRVGHSEPRAAPAQPPGHCHARPAVQDNH